MKAFELVSDHHWIFDVPYSIFININIEYRTLNYEFRTTLESIEYLLRKISLRLNFCHDTKARMFTRRLIGFLCETLSLRVFVAASLYHKALNNRF